MKRFFILHYVLTMTTFVTAQRLTNRRFFISLIPQFIFLLIILVVFNFFLNEERRITVLLTYGILLLGNIIGLLQLEKLEELRFDEDKKELHFYFKSYFSKLRKLRTPFEGLEVIKKKDLLKVVKGRRKVFAIDLSDKSFSHEQLNNIMTAFQKNDIPVK